MASWTAPHRTCLWIPAIILHAYTMIIFLRIVGVTSVLLAILGAFLPLLPTTPFVLLASACLARSSPRLHARLRSSRLLGTLLTDYETGRGVPMRAKLIALALMWASMAWTMSMFTRYWVIGMLAAIGLAVSVVILRLPTRKPIAPASGSGDPSSG